MSKEHHPTQTLSRQEVGKAVVDEYRAKLALGRSRCTAHLLYSLPDDCAAYAGYLKAREHYVHTRLELEKVARELVAETTTDEKHTENPCGIDHSRVQGCSDERTERRLL